MYFERKVENQFNHADLYPLAYSIYCLLAYRHCGPDSLSICLAAIAAVSIVGICRGVEF